MAGCTSGGPRGALAPAGPLARHVDWLWWILLIVSSAVFVAVMVALVLAMTRSHEAPDKQALPATAERSVLRVVAGSVGLTAIILLGLLVATVLTERRLAAAEVDADALHVAVTGRQWWWDIEYQTAEPWRRVRTANELHIPAGRPVRLTLHSSDVIHSFWVPSLNGKRDLVPGRENTLWLQADRPGVFEGQCAEFCGRQHARMRIVVVAHPPEEFDQWLERERAAAREPQSESEKRGREVFLGATCIMCHTVRGTYALSKAGPDLTHLGSRRMLAANTIPNNRGNLAGWILDPEGIKPGNRMPPHRFAAEELHALLDYLESLK